MANKPIAFYGMEPAIDMESYDAVPWYRTIWTGIFPPALMLVALTGDVFMKATKKMKEYSEADVWRFTLAMRALFVVVGLIVAVVVYIPIFG